MKIYKVYNKQNMLKILLFVTILFLLLIFSKQNFDSVKKSTELFLNSVFPSLFPFFLFTELILNSNIIDVLVQYFGNIISKIFKINKNSTPAIIIGFLCGYPMGAKVVSELYEKNKISKNEVKRLLLFVNNCNPVFIISTIGISIFGSKEIGVILFLSHFLSSVIIGISSDKFNSSSIIYKFNKDSNNKNENNPKESLSFFDTLKKAILKSFMTLSNILGFIIIFNLLFDNLSILLETINANSLLTYFLSGIFEVTRGCKEIANFNINLNLKICIISFLLGFSGVCILCQIYSCIYKQNFKFKTLFISKTIQGLLSFIITYIMLKFINLDTIYNLQTFSNVNTYVRELDYLKNIKNTYLNSIYILLASLFIFVILYTLYHNKSKR